MLITRLAIAALLIGAAAGVLADIAERNHIAAAVSDRAVLGAAELRAAIAAPGAEGEVDRTLEAKRLSTLCARRASVGPTLTMGRFVVIRLLDTAGVEIAHCTDGGVPHSDDILAAVAAVRPPLAITGAAPAPTVLRVDGTPLLNVFVPLSDGFVEGGFAMSGPALSAARWNMVRAAGLAVATVLIIALILYPVILSLLRRLERLSRDLLDANLETLRVIGSAIAKRDSDTDIHNYRVTIYAVRLAEALGLDEPAIRILIKGAFLHDVGKIGIRDAVLLKPGRLSEEEYREMQQHVRHGLDIVRRSTWLREAEAVVGGHHEKFDGSGYDYHVPGNTIPSLARIFTVADVFDALSSKRPYKDPMPYDRVVSILREGRGTHFDPVILDRFLEIAKPLHDAYSHSDDRAPGDLEAIITRYFQTDLGAFL